LPVGIGNGTQNLLRHMGADVIGSMFVKPNHSSVRFLQGDISTKGVRDEIVNALSCGIRCHCVMSLVFLDGVAGA